MDVMLVGTTKEAQDKLAESIPLAPTDKVFLASGMLSAIWYGKAMQPDLIVIDLWPPDCCCHRLAELLEPFCPSARVLLCDRAGNLLPPALPADGQGVPMPPASGGDVALARS